MKMQWERNTGMVVALFILISFTACKQNSSGMTTDGFINSYSRETGDADKSMAQMKRMQDVLEEAIVQNANVEKCVVSILAAETSSSVDVQIWTQRGAELSAEEEKAIQDLVRNTVTGVNVDEIVIRVQ